MPTKTKSKGVGIGTQFRSHYADSNPLWEVKAKAGPAAWKCISQSEQIVIDGRTFERDYVGVEKIFSTKEILAILAFENMWDQSAKESENFYDSLRTGQIVHYHDCFGAFVRCEAVILPDGERKLKPVALVGTWHWADLPRRCRDGTVHLGFRAEQIAKGELFAPHYSCIFEAPGYARNQQEEDPRQLLPIDLSVPPMTAEQAAQVKLWQTVQQAAAVLNDHNQRDPQKRLDAARAILRES